MLFSDEDLLQWTRQTLSNLSLSPKKALGQNFLISKRVIKRQIELAELKPEHVVLEIGGGLGVLTHAIRGTGARVIVIEYSKKLADFLTKQFQEDEGVKIIQGDALKLEFPKTSHVISNLPYSISTPITEKILLAKIPKAVLMYQLEVAQRIIAKAGTQDYSRLSMLAQAFSIPRLVFTVPKNKFYPPPKVNSAVVTLQRKESNYEQEFIWLTRELFQRKNKSIRSALKRIHKQMKWGEIEGFKCLQEYLEKRVIQLTPEDVYNMIKCYLLHGVEFPIKKG